MALRNALSNRQIQQSFVSPINFDRVGYSPKSLYDKKIWTR
jgi:hypothetical protein